MDEIATPNPATCSPDGVVTPDCSYPARRRLIVRGGTYPYAGISSKGAFLRRSFYQTYGKGKLAYLRTYTHKCHHEFQYLHMLQFTMSLV